MWTDRQTDVKKLILASRSYVNAPEIEYSRDRMSAWTALSWPARDRDKWLVLVNVLMAFFDAIKCKEFYE
jgi:hypothetical protein